MKIPDVPYQVTQWKREHPGEDIPDGHAHPALACRAQPETARPDDLLPVPLTRASKAAAAH